MAKSKKAFDVFNPADGQIVGSVPDMSEEDTEYAITAAKKAFIEWKTTTPKVLKNYILWVRGFCK